MAPSKIPLFLPLLLSAAALAQPSAVEHAQEGRGVTLPPTSLSLIDEAPAVSLNPAGLSFVGDTQLHYLHERSVGRDRVIDSIFLADTLFGGLGLGVGVEWVRSGSLPDYRRTTWAISGGNPYLSLGLAWHILSSTESADLEGLNSVDLALSSRPSRYFSLAAVVRNVDPPAKGAVALTREYGFGVGLRPLGERYSLGVDYLFDDAGGPGAGRFSYALQAELLQGVVLGAGVSHGLRSSDDFLIQVGLTLNTPNFGVGYAGGGGPGGLDHVISLRASRQKYRPISFSAGTLAMIDVDDVLAGGTSTVGSLLGLSQDDPYVRLTRLLYNAARDPALKGLVLKVDGMPGVGLGKAEELRQTVLALRSAGKKVIAVLLSAEDNAYLVASAADQIFAVSEANLFINGFAANATFLGGAMEKLDVSWDVARVGAYKNFPDQFTRSDMSKEQREAVDAYLDTDWRQYEAAVTQGRGISKEQLQLAIKDGLLSPARALQLRLIDAIITPDELDKKLTELLPGIRFDPEYRPRGYRQGRWGERRKIAVVPVIGSISGGKSRSDPLGLQEIAGAETVVRALKAAEEDPAVEAIVVRVDSGGGDGLASDLMYRAVLEAKKKKPVVASMGDVAASGGYYAAMGADEVFASTTTVTGSIGVFLIKPAVKGLAEKLGVKRETIVRGESANLLDIYQPWSPADRERAQKWVDAFYDGFITEVSKSRHLAKEQVDTLARGRVWSGEDAKARGLVDTLGGFAQAIESARTRAKIAPSEEVDLVIYGNAKGPLSALGGEPGVLTRLAEQLSPAAPPSPLVDLARAAGLSSTLLLEPGLKAMMEYELHVR